MFHDTLLVLSEKDLCKDSKDKVINEIQLEDFTKSPMEFYSVILYNDDWRNSKILKNKYGKIGRIILKEDWYGWWSKENWSS